MTKDEIDKRIEVLGEETEMKKSEIYDLENEIEELEEQLKAGTFDPEPAPANPHD